MNYLAHAYLSFQHPALLIGNMISDFVKGKSKFGYPPGVQLGIQLHRQIDAFTDDHSATKEAKQVFKPYVGLYAGAFMDVVYDHFLAADENEFPGNSLARFAEDTYKVLYDFEHLLPAPFAAMLPYMSRHNWLLNYKHLDGIKKSFEGVVRRASYLNSSEDVFRAFVINYDNIKPYYDVFFPDVKQFALDEANRLINGLNKPKG